MELSPKMQEVMNYLVNAEYYYMDETKEGRDGKTAENFHTADGCVAIGFLHAHIVANDMVCITGHTNTLKALEKRGLIEIVHLGGSLLDVVRVKYFNPPAPLKTALKILVKIDAGRYSQNLQMYATPEAVDLVADRYAKRGNVTVDVLGEIELSIWDPLK